MQIANKRTILLLAVLGISTMLSGCINWEKKYKALLAENANLRGRYEAELGKQDDYAKNYYLHIMIPFSICIFRFMFNIVNRT